MGFLRSFCFGAYILVPCIFARERDLSSSRPPSGRGANSAGWRHLFAWRVADTSAGAVRARWFAGIARLQVTQVRAHGLSARSLEHHYIRAREFEDGIWTGEFWRQPGVELFGGGAEVVLALQDSVADRGAPLSAPQIVVMLLVLVGSCQIPSGEFDSGL